MKKTKIICSIGPASCNTDVMSKMVENGMNVARINFSHATIEERENVVKTVKEVRDVTGKNVAILYDTKGPEFRSGMLKNDEIVLEEGKTIRIVKEEISGTEEAISVNHPNAIDSLNIGNIISLENGLMEIEVISKEDDGVTCKIISGGKLGNKKSISVPGVSLDIPFISDIDKEDIIYACKNDGDFLALSFVSKKENVLEARRLCEENGNGSIKIISKIESLEGIENIDEILDVSDGIMVARGDLGVEVPMVKLPYYQKYLIEHARKKGKIAIVATEMLESMKKSIRPTRAEVTDISNAVLNGTDAVMLSGETTTGLYPIQTVKAMADICENTESYYKYKNKDSKFGDVEDAIAMSVTESASLVNANLIVASTMSGLTARLISNFRPSCLILAVCTTNKVARSLALNYGVYPAVVEEYSSTDEVISSAINCAKEFAHLEKGNKIIITGGFPITNQYRRTNLMRIHEF